MIRNLIRTFYYHPVIRFLTVGVIGLMCDATVLYALRHAIGLIPAKIVSYIVAFTVTWLLNRIFTFRSQDPKHLQEWLRCACIYVVTGVIHVLIFAFLIGRYTLMYHHPIIALLITAAIIAVFNYLALKYFVFKMLSDDGLIDDQQEEVQQLQTE